MSWLMNHYRHFVLPGIHTLARHQDGRGLTVRDIKPRDKEIRPSTKCKYPEAGLLYALVSSVFKKGHPTRELALGLCRQVGRARDAEFVYALDQRGSVKDLGDKYDGVEGPDVLHSMLCNSMRRLKRKMRRKGSLLLPGRDVWAWEVMARKLSVDSTFDPRVSRGVARSKSALRVCIDEWQIQDWSDVLFFDTGFSGTIPRAIAAAEGLGQINMLLLSSHDREKQIFRTHTGSRAKALAFEYLVKYFLSGTERDGEPYQQLSLLDEFVKAVMLTIWLWYHISPTRLPSYRDKKIKVVKKGSVTLNGGGDFSSAWASDLLTVQPTTGSTSTLGGFQLTTSSSNTSSITCPTWSINDSSVTGGATTLEAGATLDHLWGAGASGTILVEQGVAPKPPLTIMDQIKQEMDKEVIASLLEKGTPPHDPNTLLKKKGPPAKYPGVPKKKKVVPAKALQVSKEAVQNLADLGIHVDAEELAAIEAEAEILKLQQDYKSKLKEAMTGPDSKLKINPDFYSTEVFYGPEADALFPVTDPGAIPIQDIPPDMAFLPADHPPKKLKGYILDPNTFKLMDPNTGAYVEDQIDQQMLSILKGDTPPSSEGYELGQYPGPPVIDAQKLKELAGDPFGPIPNVSLSIEMGKAPDGSPCFVKKTVIETPKGKKVYTLPIMQKGKKVTQLPFAV